MARNTKQIKINYQLTVDVSEDRVALLLVLRQALSVVLNLSYADSVPKIVIDRRIPIIIGVRSVRIRNDNVHIPKGEP